MIADDEADMSASQAAFELFHDIIDARLRRRRLTVADSTALQPDARAALRQIARRWKVPTIAILFSLPEEACLKWDQDRPRRVGPPVIHRQWERFQHARQAVPDEGFDQVVILEADDLDRVQVELETDKALKTELH
jgi:predicted kinase